MKDFRLMTEKDFLKLEEERKQYVPNLFIETIDHNEIISELRFIYGYLHIGWFLLNGKDEIKLELHITKIDGEFYARNIHLAFIGVSHDKRGKGLGHKHLEILTELADRYGYDMDLEIDEKFGMDKEVLRKFYSSHGFVIDQSKVDTMYRQAKSVVQ